MHTRNPVVAWLCAILFMGFTSACGDSDGDGDGDVTVVFNWVYFVSTHGCMGPPICILPICGASGGCSCQICATPPCTAAYTLTLGCCTQTTMIKESDLGQLASDYPACTLTQTSPATYALDCDWNDGAPAYLLVTDVTEPNNSPTVGTPFKYTTAKTCTWSPPYAVP